MWFPGYNTDNEFFLLVTTPQIMIVASVPQILKLKIEINSCECRWEVVII